MKIAAIQMISGADLEHNIATARRLLIEAAEDGIRDIGVTGVQTCALPI